MGNGDISDKSEICDKLYLSSAYEGFGVKQAPEQSLRHPAGTSIISALFEGFYNSNL